MRMSALLKLVIVIGCLSMGNPAAAVTAEMKMSALIETADSDSVTVADAIADPDVSAMFEAECPAPQELWSFTLTSQSGQETISYFCFEEFAADYPKAAQWLGTIPAHADPSFGAPLICADGDAACETARRELETRYVDELHAATLSCGAKQGTLFLQFLEQQVDVRCSYLAITVYIPAGDEQMSYEEPVSADTSMFIADIDQ